MKSTIVEIIRAYQPANDFNLDHAHLQQQKLLELTSQLPEPIYIYYLQQQKLLELTSQQAG